MGSTATIMNMTGQSKLSSPNEVEWRNSILETLAVVLIVLWLFGLVFSYTMGGLIHILLVLTVVVILIRVIQGRRL